MESKTQILVKAFADISRILQWYDKLDPEISNRFLLELEMGIENIGSNPTIYKSVLPDIQRFLMKKFPYVIFFSNQNDRIIILRVRHKKQKSLARYF